ncbi:MAG TPA: hypothetical protein VIO62_13750 [Candidatus Dormibacteraeota bacterium]|jgi:hypothetical protein
MPSEPTERGPRFLAVVGTIALLAGLALWVLTIAVSRSDISGNGWSLSGNGALIVPFGIGPALVAGGWAAIILRLRGHADWLRLGSAAGGIGIVLVIASLLSLVVLGAASGGVGPKASIFFELLGFLWVLASPVIALLLPRSPAAARRPIRWSIGAAVLLPIALIAGCQAGTGFLPS